MDVPISYRSTPARVVNQAADMLGKPGMIIGDIDDGTVVAETARRNYGQGLRQLLRTAHWDWARTRQTLDLLGDATGTNTDPSVSTTVEQPWTYAYAWPTDAVQGRWLPWNPANAQPTDSSGIPLTTGLSAIANVPMIPGRFLVSSSNEYPVVVGTVPWTQLPDLSRTEGLGPVYRKIILTDCPQADFVYTRLGTVIEEWDDLFRQAFVTMLALVLLPVAVEDERARTAEYDRLVIRLRNAIADARLASANEAGYPQSTDHQPVWITGRSSGWYGASPGLGGSLYSGYTFYPWDGSMSWCGSTF